MKIIKIEVINYFLYTERYKKTRVYFFQEKNLNMNNLY